MWIDALVVVVVVVVMHWRLSDQTLYSIHILIHDYDTEEDNGDDEDINGDAEDDADDEDENGDAGDINMDAAGDAEDDADDKDVNVDAEI